MTLKTLIEDDVDDVFMNTTEFAEECSYVQGNLAEITCTGIPYKAEYEAVNSEGFTTKVVSKDWLIPADDLAAITPRAGDQIRRTVGTETHVYEVVPIDENTPAVERDDTGFLFRLHSKLIRVEA